ncbi:hypothetical protein [Amnibacterium setariae]|uniref:DUF2207 domain-containing protein n=1 Tax=Amnibacterium setariae TaxID=2306585 RepID=A0A3A1U6R2_9MICO|nr:hypothetical protein [Amnibacterium setariae]RIX28614.1 hypothetical protein D1781_14495 [Amnibacterium setariae]
MKWLLTIGIVLLAVAAGLLIGGLTWPAIIVGVIGLIVLLAALFRRSGRPGDFSRSGWTGQ